jgi:hypothetical protein
MRDTVSMSKPRVCGGPTASVDAGPLAAATLYGKPDRCTLGTGIHASGWDETAPAPPVGGTRRLLNRVDAAYEARGIATQSGTRAAPRKANLTLLTRISLLTSSF